MGRVKSTINFFADIIFPIECLGCGKEGRWLCAVCSGTIPINRKPYCLSCKTDTLFGEFCGDCRPQYSLDGVFIASDYDHELVKKAIKLLKYRFVYDISRELSQLLILFIKNCLSARKTSPAPGIITDFFKTTVIPVPLHKRRQRWRGFNQAEKLADNFADYFELEINRRDLRRIIHTKPQAKLNEAARKNNLAGSFIWRGGVLTGRNIIIIDDVATTGSTLEECAKILKQSGAKEVWGLVAAKG